MNKIKYIIKYSPILYNIYFYIFSTILKIIGFFIKMEDKIILFSSFGGRKYDDSPKVIFETMLKDNRYNKYTFVWELNEINKISLPERALIVKSGTFSFFKYALKAHVWITNSSMEKGLCFKKKENIYVNTWHGTPIKYLGNDVKKEGGSFRGKSNSVENIFFTQSEYDEEIFKKAFDKKKENLYRFGLPRNDELAKVDLNQIELIKKKLGISLSKKVILYAPTFREYSKNNLNEISLEIPIDFNKWAKSLGDNIIILFRAHYEVAKYINISQYKNVIDVSLYSSLNELMIISDILMSDYSSIFFDYSILHRPMICFAYDYEIYKEKRGMYIEIKEELPCRICYSEEEVLLDIREAFQNYEVRSKETEKFQKKYVTECGYAAEKFCDFLIKKLER